MPKASILIVEDEAIVAEDLSRKLRRLDYEISAVCPCGEDAVVLAREERPDLMLMDILLAGAMDGVAAAERIRHECDIPVIYLTAHSDPATLQRAKLTEPFGYILKPFQEMELETHIQVALHKHQAEREVRQQRALLSVTLNSIGDGVVTTDASGKITSLNALAEALTGWTNAEATHRPFGEVLKIIDEKSGQPAPDFAERVLKEGKVIELAANMTLITRAGRQTAIEDSAAPIRDSRGQVLGVVMAFRDVTERRRLEKEREQLIADLQKALADVKTLSGLLPICCSCKNIRDDTGYWKQIELYIRDHSNANFTHSICPECTKKLYPEFESL